MSFKIDYLEKMVIVTFNEGFIEPHILNAFIKLTENGDIKKLNHIVFDYTNITSFTTTSNFVETLRTFTQFSVDWNKNINAITVATNINIRAMVTEIMKHSKKLVWNYMLFDNLNDALKWCDKNK